MDQFCVLNSDQLRILCIVAVVVIIVLWLCRFKLSTSVQLQYKGQPLYRYENMENVEENNKGVKNGGKCAYVDASTGAIVDGPSFEGGDIDKPSWYSGDLDPSMYFLDDGADGEFSIQNNMCSKSCCSNSWPSISVTRKDDPYVCAMKEKGELMPSNLTCNNAYQDTGCLCLNKKQYQFLSNRGTNSDWI